jgi:hypothetical protein
MAHATWSPSQLILKHLDHEEVAAATHGVALFVVDIDVWGADGLLAHGLDARVVPALWLLDETGAPVHDATITGAAWKANTPENMAPPLGAFFRKHGASAPPSPPGPSPADEVANEAPIEHPRARAAAGPLPAPASSPSTPATTEPKPMHPAVGIGVFVAAALLIGGVLCLGLSSEKDEPKRSKQADAIAEQVRKAGAAVPTKPAPKK